ncbi:MAG: L,D-transpeptidase [Deltaproteobacteria bacterium]|nr:L,D-transpeptidase [Deltaproteobacteria bacterium]
MIGSLVRCLLLAVGLAVGISNAHSTNTQSEQAIAKEIQISFPPYSAKLKESTRYTVVDIASQSLACYEFGELKKVCIISSARKGYKNFLGQWKVGFKEVNKKSKKYGVKMPYAVQISGHYFIHQGHLPGYPASHGCIRLSAEDAQWYYSWAQTGDSGITVCDLGKANIFID